jgi:long-chain fatty acid transport protein
MLHSRTFRLTILCLFLQVSSPNSSASAGYFALGYGPIARQMAGATTAYGDDAFAGSSNPAKWLAAGNQFNFGNEFFMPYRKVERTGSNTIYDFSTKSVNDVFLIPEMGYSHRISDRLVWGITVYGNGGLNTEYRGTNQIPGSTANPARCGNQAANFLLGCGKLGFDLIQLVMAPGFAYQIAPKHSIGIALLIALQRFKAYGFQAFEPFSKTPGDVSNRGVDFALGAGVRVGWLSELTPWLTVGAAYASRVYMGKFEHYEGLLADQRLDIPENYSVAFAVKPSDDLTLTFDYLHVSYGDVKATSNTVTATLRNPVNSALGTPRGTGFNWGDSNTYRFGAAYALTKSLILRGGYAYGERPQRDTGIDSVTLNMFAPSPIHQASVGLSWQLDKANEFHFAYSNFVHGSFQGPSATALLGIGGEESIKAHVNTVMLAWSRRM